MKRRFAIFAIVFGFVEIAVVIVIALVLQLPFVLFAALVSIHSFYTGIKGLRDSTKPATGED